MTKSVLSDFMDRLIEQRDRLETLTMLEMFEADQNRFERMSIELDGLVFDYSKNRMDDEALSLLIEMAEHAQLEKHRNAMLSGQKVNQSEGRAALHTALRNQSGNAVELDGKDVMPEVKAELAKAGQFAETVRAGKYQVSGGKVTDVVNIGIGGSDLGPRMVVEALKSFHDGPKVHFVANVDAGDLQDTLSVLNPATTLFIVASKSFTTAETMLNARSAKAWMEKHVGTNASAHFCAISTNLEATREFGITDERTFAFWDWVGGRYSVWSSIGLSVLMAIGEKQFLDFLRGAHAADRHFATAPLAQNIPVVMSLLSIWYRNVWNMPAQAIVPYDHNLQRFPAWLQQIAMESNGKSVTQSGEPVLFDTSPIIFGEPGTNGQHAFFQMLHQGTDVIPCDFLIAAQRADEGAVGANEHQHALLSNCLAQSEALMRGRSMKEAGGDPNRFFEGNRPSNTFLYQRLAPHTLGMLMAFYEHKTFVEGVIWGINSFDQWGVELGKELASSILAKVAGQDVSNVENGSTRGLLQALQKLSKT